VYKKRDANTQSSWFRLGVKLCRCLVLGKFSDNYIRMELELIYFVFFIFTVCDGRLDTISSLNSLSGKELKVAIAHVMRILILVTF